MSESPWNAKSRRRRAPQALRPESAKVGHVPLAPPAPRPTARLNKRSKAPARPASQQAAQTSARPNKPKAIKPSPVQIIFLTVCLLALLVAGIQYAGKQSQLNKLVAIRQAEAQRIENLKQEHLNARRSSGYLPLIERFAKEYSVDASFVSAIIKCESSYQSTAVSRVNARGLMQIMPETGTWLAGRLGLSNYQPDALFDPETNIRFGAHYLAYLSDMFAGNPVMVAAAYHAGANNVKHWALNRAEDQKTISLDNIPMKDTQSYVGKVMTAYAIYYENDTGGDANYLGNLPVNLSTVGRSH